MSSEYVRGVSGEAIAASIATLALAATVIATPADREVNVLFDRADCSVIGDYP